MIALRLAAPVMVCLAALPATAQEPLRVLATVGMVADVAGAVGGACVSVTTMIGDGSDPHLYQATPSDVQALQQADLIVYGGFGLEGKLADILDRLGQSRATLGLGPTAIAQDALISEHNGGVDPHVWMDASLWATTAPAMAEALAALRPDCADAIQASGLAYQAQALALHDWVKASIATIPEGQRRLITAHDAFGYYARAYGIPVSSVQGLSTESEAAIADIEAVAATVADNGIPAVFIESTISPRTIEAVIEAVNARGKEVTIGGQLLSDAMGPPGTAEGTWFGMIHANTLTITTALGGTPPPLPEALADWAASWDLAP